MVWHDLARRASRPVAVTTLHAPATRPPNGWTMPARSPILIEWADADGSIWSAGTPPSGTPTDGRQAMGSRVRDLAEFLRNDRLTRCDSPEGAESTDDPYIAAAKRILVRVHQYELPVAAQDKESSARPVEQPPPAAAPGWNADLTSAPKPSQRQPTPQAVSAGSQTRPVAFR